MDPATIGARIASAAIGPLIKRLFRPDGPGAGLVDKPVRVSSLVSFRGEKATLTEKDLGTIAEEIRKRAAKADPRYAALHANVQGMIRLGLAHALSALGELDMDDVQAVRLGPRALAERITVVAMPGPPHVDELYDELIHTVCLHILNFFTQRSTFVARTLVEQSQQLQRLVDHVDLLIDRTPDPLSADATFERRYAAFVTTRHNELTIFGLDLDHAREWPLDVSYVSLQVVGGPGTSAPASAEQQLGARDHDRVLLRGVAGSGKTTLAQWLAVSCVRADLPETMRELVGRVPFFLPLRALTHDALPAPRDFLAAAGCPHTAPDGWAERVLAAGRGLLLIDGVDEVPESERDATRRWLRGLLAAFPGNRWLVTSRPSAVRQDWLVDQGFAELSLSPMNRTAVTTFVHRWHTATGTAQELAAQLTLALRTKQELGRLATNPLMCGLICALHRERNGFLPHSRKELYDAALTMLLERRDTERRIRLAGGRQFGKEPQIQLLQKLAYWLIRNGRSEMDRADAVAVLAAALPAMPYLDADPPQVYRYLLERSGLLREPSEGRMAFVHRTFQDYLGGRMAVEELDFPLLVRNAHHDQWEDVVRMAVAHARPVERARLLTELIRADDSATHLRRLTVAAASLEHATELDPAVRQAIADQLAQFVPPRSQHRARSLAELGSPLVLDLLPGPEELTKDEAYNVVTTAIGIGTDAAIPLLARYADHPSQHVRAHLMDYWDRFDVDRYADEVIARIPDDGFYFTVATTEQLVALRRLGGRPRIWVTGNLSTAEITANVVADRLTHLHLRPRYTTRSLEWLAAFPRLEFVHFSGRRRPVFGVPDGVRVVWH
ncbi:NACHT domain-containing protein [Streptomyces hainanensis]|uniref:NACHT domain-containing protein n=1 Tax=Streptomyces hainanensis TaxID=402648 RepID=A0A4R4TKN1_9ACTN|nr:NACHT domain-containing protein [Streptomyces hainanensis]TDC78320.1 NACHT domain-containing protein [Streptomyces hainanensis]